MSIHLEDQKIEAFEIGVEFRRCEHECAIEVNLESREAALRRYVELTLEATAAAGATHVIFELHKR